MISQQYFLFNVFALAIGTLCIRGLFIAVSEKVVISKKARDLFTYIPAAVLPALIVPAAFFHHGRAEWLMGKERFLILIISSVVCYFVRNTLFIICLGLAILYVVSQL